MTERSEATAGISDYRAAAEAAGPRLAGMAYHLLKPERRPLSTAASTVERWLIRVAADSLRADAAAR